MKANDFVLLSIHALGGEIQGKTKLQKTMYFLGLLTGHLDALGYRPHYYGPYSDDVEYALTWMRVLDVLDQTSAKSRTLSGQPGVESRRFDFRLNERGLRFAQTKASEFPDFWETLTDAVRRLRAAGDLDYIALSIAAKTHFMLSKWGQGASAQELEDRASKFGWEVPQEQIHKAIDYLGRLQLVDVGLQP